FHAYTYVWRDDQSDADLALDGAVVTVDAQEWEVPSQAGCLRCHLETAGNTLGLELAQLHRDQTYNGVEAHQIATLRAIGFVTELGHPDDLPTLAGYDDADTTLAAR